MSIKKVVFEKLKFDQTRERSKGWVSNSLGYENFTCRFEGEQRGFRILGKKNESGSEDGEERPEEED